ncbi:hypothetical protein Tco_1122328 [Tanacetum coccineum]|uniref:Uncharacterized protein n=1 Tax=Tanacetum coccineum TaxID=301880 RepID=A0ABQ5J393_9ASTR
MFSAFPVKLQPMLMCALFADLMKSLQKLCVRRDDVKAIVLTDIEGVMYSNLYHVSMDDDAYSNRGRSGGQGECKLSWLDCCILSKALQTVSLGICAPLYDVSTALTSGMSWSIFKTLGRKFERLKATKARSADFIFLFFSSCPCDVLTGKK